MEIMSIAENTLQTLLALCARAVLRRYRPQIIAVTGTAGKTSTKEAIFAVLEQRFMIRRSEKSFNTEIGVPLTIIGGKNHHKNIIGWLWEFVRAIGLLVVRKAYPSILLLEYGVQKPGDMTYLVHIGAPDIAVITAFGSVPVHVEFFKDPRALFDEKARIANAFPEGGILILNADDERVCAVGNGVRARVITFGFSDTADVRISQYALCGDSDALPSTIPTGISFALNYRGASVSVRMRAFGKPQAYSAGAAAAVGVALGMDMKDAVVGLSRYVPPPGRLNVLQGIKGSIIIDDTYNSSPVAVEEALNVLKEFPGQRKIAVLGDMKELGGYAEAAHRLVGEQAAIVADLILTVGECAKGVGEGARTYADTLGVSHPDAIHELSDAIGAGKFLRPLLRKGDAVLVKGSRSMHMERVIVEIMAEPEKAVELLVQ